MRILYIFLFFVCTSSIALADNLITNGDFESGDLSSWLPVGGNIFVEELNGNAPEPPSDADHGNYAVKIFGQFTGGFNQSIVIQNLIPATAGTSYDACVEMYTAAQDQTSGANRGFLRLAFFDSGGIEIGGINSQQLNASSPTDTWINECVTMVAPDGTTNMGVFIFHQQEDNSGGAIFYDNASLCETPAPDPIPTMGEWGLLILTFLFLIVGVVSLKPKYTFAH